MRTEDLIRALAADTVRPTVLVGRRLLSGAIAGAVLAVVAFSLTLQARPDLSEAWRSPAFICKLVVAASLAMTAGCLLPQAARPVPIPGRRHTILLVAPVLLTFSVAAELYVQPAGIWWSRLLGENAIHCLWQIPFLAAAPALCLLVALLHGAPGRPAVAGAVAGLVSGGFAALLYGLTCPDDSPLFVATWYTVAIAIVTGATTCAGTRLLRW